MIPFLPAAYNCYTFVKSCFYHGRTPSDKVGIRSDIKQALFFSNRIVGAHLDGFSFC